MEKIVNGLVLSPEQKAAFLAAAPGVEQIFLRDGEITAADLSGATVLLGNPSPAVVQQGGHALRWMHTRSAGADPYMPEEILPQGRTLLIGGGLRHFGFGAHVRHAARPDEAAARLPGQPER